MTRATTGTVLQRATVVITGAAHGMGTLFARRAVAEGASAVALWDVDQPFVEALAKELRVADCRVRAFVVDLSCPEQIAATARRTREELGAPNIVINNAGIGHGGPFALHDPAQDIEATMRINALAPMLVTREFLPDMMADRSREQRILNMASAAGTVANPNMSVYAASKWALIGWGESRRLELSRSGRPRRGDDLLSELRLDGHVRRCARTTPDPHHGSEDCGRCRVARDARRTAHGPETLDREARRGHSRSASDASVGSHG